ncbi:MAG: hypothetical protein HQL69_23760 [Magnetococcales bacterium]|nr:hypothetical protein [Magnetococcales bacterium]
MSVWKYVSVQLPKEKECTEALKCEKTRAGELVGTGIFHAPAPDVGIMETRIVLSS